KKKTNNNKKRHDTPEEGADVAIRQRRQRGGGPALSASEKRLRRRPLAVARSGLRRLSQLSGSQPVLRFLFRRNGPADDLRLRARLRIRDGGHFGLPAARPLPRHGSVRDQPPPRA